MLNSQPSQNNLVVLAGFPKSGNTLINETFNYAGKFASPGWTPPKYEYQNQEGISKLETTSFIGNPFLGEQRCHIKTHLAYSDYHYSSGGQSVAIERIIVIIRNPFDTLLSATNYLRYSASLNKRLTANQIATLKHFYPNYTETDVLTPNVFNLEKLRDEGALDHALEIFSASNTCIPQFMNRSGTWLDFYASFSQAKQPVLRIRFEDIVNSTDNYQKVSSKLSQFLGCDTKILATAFGQQNEACREEKNANNLFFPVAEANYFEKYFGPKTLRRFCKRHGANMIANGYENLVNRIMSRKYCLWFGHRNKKKCF
jgi:hypothetical protein